MSQTFNLIMMCGALFSACGLMKVIEYGVQDAVEEAIEEDLSHHERAPHHFHKYNRGVHPIEEDNSGLSTKD